MNYLPGLASNHHSPDFCLLRSKDYRHEPLAPSLFLCFLLNELHEHVSKATQTKFCRSKEGTDETERTSNVRKM
jgi:hypothetical protein